MTFFFFQITYNRFNKNAPNNESSICIGIIRDMGFGVSAAVTVEIFKGAAKKWRTPCAHCANANANPITRHVTIKHAMTAPLSLCFLL